jgi:carboxyl-terminal processing protease
MVTAGPDPAPLEVADPTLLLDVRVDPPALNEAFASATSASIGVVGEAVAAPSKTASRNVLALSIAIAMVSILAGSALFFSGYSLGRAASADPGTPGADATAFQPFWDTYHTIRDRYAGAEVDQATIISGAIRGMIQSLNDPYSAYLSSDDYVKSLLGVNGQFEGVGAEIAGEAPDGTKGCTPLGTTCRLVVTRPIPGSPADRAGVAIGDVIVATDGASVLGLTPSAALDRIRGPKGSVVTLTIKRGTTAAFTVPITRDVVQEQEVLTDSLAADTVGYVRMNDFSDRAADQVAADLAAHVKAGRTKLILDLRGNLGGYVTAARKVASQFIGSGVIFWEQDAAGDQVATNALADGVATAGNLRIVCLINSSSASASEIVAGALQDNKRATLIGQTSYGKGTVQQWQELTDQGGAFKLTVARWLTPNKHWIHGKGLTPDVPVTVPANTPDGVDPVLAKALEVLGGSASETVWDAAV